MWRFFHFFVRNKDILYALLSRTISHNATQDSSFPLSASHRIILVCLFTQNGSHIHLVGRFIAAILLECDDFSTFLPEIRTSCTSLSPPTRSDNSTQDGSFPLCASHRIILVCLFTPNGSHIDIVGCFMQAILLECDDFSTFRPAIKTSGEAYCRQIEAIIRYRMVHSPSLPAIGEYWYVYSRQMAAIFTWLDVIFQQYS